MGATVVATKVSRSRRGSVVSSALVLATVVASVIAAVVVTVLFVVATTVADTIIAVATAMATVVASVTGRGREATGCPRTNSTIEVNKLIFQRSSGQARH